MADSTLAHAPELRIPAQADQIFASADRQLSPAPVLVVISGPSGVGKDSVIKRMRELSYPFHFVVTATTRPPRPGEVHGVDYYFVSKAEFEQMIAEGELFEHALVYGQFKGVPKGHVRQALASGVDVIMRLDVQGAAAIKRQVPQALTIFVLPPSLDVLVDRLRRRASDTAAQMQQRLETALSEMRCIEQFDYAVVNREECLDETVGRIAAIMSAAKCRIGRRQVIV